MRLWNDFSEVLSVTVVILAVVCYFAGRVFWGDVALWSRVTNFCVVTGAVVSVLCGMRISGYYFQFVYLLVP